uniref:Mediator of RNA polymerase II transcription subunit 11 n=1 Tax=Zea mays TaxID=4577 RepID=B6TWK2_MAIZE|nr:hypothetical protein [Zea mays]
MEELGYSQGPRTDAVGAHCREFMMAMKEIQTTLREEIKSACEYRPFEKCDYSARLNNLSKLVYIRTYVDIYDVVLYICPCMQCISSSIACCCRCCVCFR